MERATVQPPEADPAPPPNRRGPPAREHTPLGYAATLRPSAITDTEVVPWVPVKSVDLEPSFTGGYIEEICQMITW